MHHQTSHLLAGFMGEPDGQFQSDPNSAMFENGPFTRNLYRRRGGGVKGHSHEI